MQCKPYLAGDRSALDAKVSPYRTGCVSAAVLLLASGLLASCTSMGTTNQGSAANTAPVYPTGYGVPVTERTVAQRLLDRSIEHTASVNIKAIDPNLSNISRIGIDSFYSEVLLTGEVPTQALKEQVLNVVRSMPDVRQVYDELSVAPNRGYSSTVQDGYITSKFMAKVLAKQGIKSSQVKAVTNNGVIYLMGRLTPTQQSHLIDIANETVGITELVLLTTLVNDAGVVLSNQDVMQEANLNASPSTSSPNRGAINVIQTPSTSTTGVAPSSNTTNTATTPSSSPYIELYKNQVNP